MAFHLAGIIEWLIRTFLLRVLLVLVPGAHAFRPGREDDPGGMPFCIDIRWCCPRIFPADRELSGSHHASTRRNHRDSNSTKSTVPKVNAKTVVTTPNSMTLEALSR